MTVTVDQLPAVTDAGAGRDAPDRRGRSSPRAAPRRPSAPGGSRRAGGVPPLSTALGLALLLLAPALPGLGPRPAAAQEEAPQQAPADTTENEDEAGQEADRDGIKPYDEVITEEAVTDSGLFVAHRIDEKLYYEIPRDELERPYLWVARIARAQQGTGYGGLKIASRVVRWTHRADPQRVLLRGVSYEAVADSTEPIFRSVQAASFEPVIQAFDVEAFGPDSSLVVEVTRLFTGDVAEFSPKEAVQASSLDGDRTFLEEVLAFPENIEVEALLTYRGGRNNHGGDGGGAFVEGMSAKTISLVMHHSMVRLPEDPMMPRLADDRVGFVELRKHDYGLDEHRAPVRRLIVRWRLECPDGETVPCEPEEPIVFYVGPGTPTEWRPWVRRGVEAWQSAFEEAGFRDAVVARNAPSPEEDPDWHPEDARYSAIRWTPSTVENAYGPNVHDPRTGQILEADIQIFHNIMNLLQDSYLVQVGPLDDRARDLPLPDSLMGRLLQYVVTHEVGHSLGFPHNMKASSSYSVDSLRSASFTERYGNEASVMDYGRFNYVAQPGDGADLIPRIGPYDRFAVMWGYRPVPGADRPRDEKEQLDRWARRQEENPMLRFGDYDGIDPSAQTEDLGDDPVEATRLGLANLRRVVPMLLEATGEEGEGYDDLRRTYQRTVNQWSREMGHVVTLVGGVYEERKHYGQEGVVHTPVPRERQEEAMEYLLERAFRPPDFLVEPELLRRFEPTGSLERIGNAQEGLLQDLLSDTRVRRLLEGAAVRSGERDPYPPDVMLRDLREGLWSELRRGTVRIGPYRRNLQRAHVRILADNLEAESEVRALSRGELQELATTIQERLGRAGDRVTRLHLEDVRARIEEALRPE